MKKIQVRESGRFVESDTGAFTVRIIREGKGSSGSYRKELLESAVPLFENSLSFANHPVNGDPTSRSFLDVVGRVGKTWYSDHEGFGAIYGEYTPMDKHRETIAELKESIGLSIFTMGEASVDDHGNVIVESFDEVDPYRSVDVVVAPGAGGSLAPLMESWRVREGLEPNRKETNTMEIEDLAKKFDELQSKIDQFATAQSDQEQAERTAEEQEEAVLAAVEAFAAKAEEIDKADLSESQRASLRSAAAKGLDISESLAEAVELRKEILAESAPKGGTGAGDYNKEPRVITEGAKTTDFTISNWS